MNGGGIVQRVTMPAPRKLPKPTPRNPVPSVRFNAKGERDEEGNVFIVVLAGSAQAWAVFDSEVRPDQTATMIFDNVSGDGILASIVTQWIGGGSGVLGANFNRPHAGEAVMVLLARQRRPGAVKVVGRNSSRAAVTAAAGLLYIPEPGG
jgi:hypothetical protein